MATTSTFKTNDKISVSDSQEDISLTQAQSTSPHYQTQLFSVHLNAS